MDVKLRLMMRDIDKKQKFDRSVERIGLEKEVRREPFQELSGDVHLSRRTKIGLVHFRRFLVRFLLSKTPRLNRKGGQTG